MKGLKATLRGLQEQAVVPGVRPVPSLYGGSAAPGSAVVASFLGVAQRPAPGDAMAEGKSAGRFTELSEAVVLDTETTGLDYEGDRVIEVAAFVVDFSGLEGEPEQEVKYFHTRINPEQAISEEAQAVHGLSNVDLQDEPRFADIAHTLRDFIADRPLVGHNIGFDKRMLHAEFKRAGVKSIWRNRGYCTQKRIGYYLMSNRAGYKRPSLDNLLRRFGIKGRAGMHHGAYEDAYLTMQLATAVRTLDELPGDVTERWSAYFGTTATDKKQKRKRSARDSTQSSSTAGEGKSWLSRVTRTDVIVLLALAALVAIGVLAT